MYPWGGIGLVPILMVFVMRGADTQVCPYGFWGIGVTELAYGNSLL